MSDQIHEVSANQCSCGRQHQPVPTDEHTERGMPFYDAPAEAQESRTIPPEGNAAPTEPTTAADSRTALFRVTLLDGSTWTDQGQDDFAAYLSQHWDMHIEAEARQPSARCPDCGLTAQEIGGLHIRAQFGKHGASDPLGQPSGLREALDVDMWKRELALIIAKARHGPGVDMGGRHNPKPSEVKAAEQFVDDLLAALAADEQEEA